MKREYKFTKESKKKLIDGAKKSAIIRKRESTELQKQYDDNPSRCKKCHTKLPYKKRHNQFCSHSCSASFNNMGIARNGKTKKDIPCLNCGTITKNPKFCCCQCKADYDWKRVKNDVQKTGIVTTAYIGKRYLLEIKGERCEICGTMKWMNKNVPLVCDHINGNPDDNTLTNLRLVCGNCDMQLPTYKSKNLGNGRYFRRKRYADGKSY